MAREGITYEQVAAQADKLVADGQQPTIRAIREALGTGSPNTVHKHLSVWRAARPQAQAQAPDLPGELVLSIAQEIERAAARARSEIEGRLVDAQAEANDLAAAGDALEGELAERVAEVATLTTDRDQAQATALERAAEIQRLVEAVDRERRSAEEARVELATARLKIEGQAEKVAELGAEIQGLRRELGKAQEVAQASAVDASRLQAELVAERAARAELASDRDSLKEDLRESGNRLLQVQMEAAGERKAAAEALAVVKDEAKGLAAQVAALTSDLKTAVGQGEKATARIFELDAELVAERTAHREGLAKLRQKLGEAEKELATSTAKAEALAESKASALADLATNRERVKALEEAADAERGRHRAELVAERTSCREELVRLRQELAEAKKPLLVVAEKE